MTDLLTMPKLEKFDIFSKLASERDKTVTVLKDKMQEEKFNLLKTYLRNEKIFLPEDVQNIEQIMSWVKINLSHEQFLVVELKKKQIEDSIEKMLIDLEKGSTTAFKNRLKEIAEKIKPFGLAVATPLALRTILITLTPTPVKVVAGAGLLIYRGVKLCKDTKKRTIANQNYELSKMIRELEIKKDDKGNIIDTRFNENTQRIIRDFFKNERIPFEDTGYLSLNSAIYSLDFENKKKLCNIINNSLGNPIDVNERLRKYDGTFFKKIKNNFSVVGTTTGYALDLVNNINDIPWLRNIVSTFMVSGGTAAVTGSLENGAVVAGVKTALEAASSFFNVGEDVVEGINVMINTMGFVGVFSAIGIVGSLAAMGVNYVKGKKERETIKKELEEIRTLDDKLYGKDNESEKELIKKKALENPDLAQVMIVSLVMEYITNLGIEIPNDIVNAQELVNYIKTLDTPYKKDILKFYDDLLYFNKHNHGIFMKHTVRVLKDIGNVLLYGAAAASLVDMFFCKGFLEEINPFATEVEKTTFNVQEPTKYDFEFGRDVDVPLSNDETIFLQDMSPGEIASLSDNDLYGKLRYLVDGEGIVNLHSDFDQASEIIQSKFNEVFGSLPLSRQSAFVEYYNNLNSGNTLFINEDGLPFKADKITNHDLIGMALRSFSGYSVDKSAVIDRLGQIAINVSTPVVAIANVSEANTDKTIKDAESNHFVRHENYDDVISNLANVPTDVETGKSMRM